MSTRFVGVPLLGALLALGCSGYSDADPERTLEPSKSESALVVTGSIVTPHPMFGGFWSPGTGTHAIRVRQNHSAFTSSYTTLWNQNLRLKSMSVHVVNGVPEYSGVWVPGTHGQVLRLGRTSAQFLADYSEWWGKGYRLIEVKSHVSGGAIFYSGIWNPSTSAQYLRIGWGQADFLQEYDKLWGQGYRLISLSTDSVNGVVFYHGVWNPSNGGQYLRLGRPRDVFIRETRSLAREGFRLAAADTYTVNHETYYDAIYNPGTATQEFAVKQESADFLKSYQTHVAGGLRLQGLIGDHTEGLSLDMYADDLRYHFPSKVVGVSATIAAGGAFKAMNAGQRRTAADGAQPASDTARLNVASVSKTITAVGVLHALNAKGISVDATITPYLPSNWTRGPNVNTITFRQLMTHTAGFRPAPEDTLSYTELRRHVAAGVVLADKATPAYRNMNYALFRVILPYINGFNPSGISESNMPTAISNAFMSYMNANVFARANIPTVGLIPTGSTRALCYPFPAGTTKGIDFGNWTDAAGGAGYQLSSNDLAKFLVALNAGNIIPLSWVSQMDAGLLGWQGFTPSKHGGLLSHGGYFPPQPGELNAAVLNFTSGVQVGIEINSSVQSGFDYFGTAIQAYDRSWVPLN